MDISLIEKIQEKLDTKLTEVQFEKRKSTYSYSLNEKREVISLSIINNIKEPFPQELLLFSNLKYLSISNIQISKSNSLKNFHFLKELELDNCDLEDSDSLGKFTSLEHLEISHCKIESIDFLKNLKNLIKLSLVKLELINIKPILKLLKLQFLGIHACPTVDFIALASASFKDSIVELELNGNSIVDISFLKGFKNARRISLHNNNVKEISNLSNLKKLETINLGSNDITDIRHLPKLENLSTLWLISNDQIKDFSPIKYIAKLDSLSLGNCGISNIDFLKGLNFSYRLDLQDNSIIDINALDTHKHLTQLNLSNNRIQNIESLKDLKQLNQLQLQENPIETLPKWVLDFDMNISWDQFGYKDNTITLHNNPLKSPPIEIVSQGKKAIHRYFEKIEKEGIDYIYEVKLTMVGEGSAGKTSLQRRLINEKSSLPRKDKRTRGIEINDWNFIEKNKKKHIAHIWDFGGQDVYYPVHRFFITENSVFVLLATTRLAHHNFDYWIPTIYQFGGNSPIIIGQTCHDGNKSPWNDLGNFIANDNFNIIKTQLKPYYEINLPNNNEGLEKVKKTIVNQIISLPHYGREVPKSWSLVRDQLAKESKKQSCISFESFIKICSEISPDSFSEPDDFGDCCRFLHDIGVVLWYSNNEELVNWVILEPQWAMNAVYLIIDDKQIQSRHGHIKPEDFKRLWHEKMYNDKHFILKKMLEIFKISFAKKHKKQSYIIPARLISMPVEEKWKNDENCLCIEYIFDFMPRGMVNQLSAELSKYIENDNKVWNNAVNFKFKNNTAIAQVEEDFYNRKISIKAKGTDARGLIILINDALENITDEYKGVEAIIEVPCICSICKESIEITKFKYHKLIEWSQKGENSSVTCNESNERILIKQLLYNVGLAGVLKSTSEINNLQNLKTKKIMNPPKKIFISYSKFDLDYLKDFQDHLVTLKDEGLVTFDCREIEFGNEWDETIKREIDECDIMVCLVSVKFLNTKYIKYIEIEKAIAQNKIIIPIIIKSCDWENSKIGKYQAAQRGKIVSLDNDKIMNGAIKALKDEEKDAFWTAIIKEFRVKIFK
ncbi:COR domain-containing protein [Psychroserpens luteolus]|uniref:COR domain-containing protein n=1 Tax=Psychroserpens luteolus TaxID=2855840 RepID=UPI001E456D9D|nr:COR domain-containing protein [Psychroserpens luteolus]MCD2260019.1 leucine-rich repeat domain-containing protein [Psychroserpens luteolus]